MNKSQLLEQACRVACEANHLDPDEIIFNPYDPTKILDKQARHLWLAQLCPEIPAIIALVQKEAHDTYIAELKKQRDRLANKVEPRMGSELK